MAGTGRRGKGTPRGVETPLDGILGYNIKCAFNAIRANLVVILREFDLRLVTYSALVIVVDRPGLRQSRLAEALQIEKANAVAVVSELEERGLISREPHATDGRAYALRATPEGEALCAAALAADRACEARLLADVPDAARLIADLRRVEDAAWALLAERG